MILRSLLLDSIPLLIGLCLVHLVWPERNPQALILKAALGIGAGFGATSLLYLVYLLLVPNRSYFFPLLLTLLVILVIVTAVRERKTAWERISWQVPSRLQTVLLSAAGLALLVTLLSVVNFHLRRPHGAFDAWMVWNRAARFIFRGGAGWQATFSPELYWGFHADYPLLVPMNVAWGWQILGEETLRFSMLQSALFLFGTVGLLFLALWRTRSLGQASLAAVLLMGTPEIIRSGSGQISDVPLIYFILASCVLLYLYNQHRKPALLALAGFMAALAAWTKNEGTLFLLVSAFALAVFLWRQKRLKSVIPYGLGLLIPGIILLYFKLVLTPSSDLFASNVSETLAKLIDLSRYWLILKSFATNFLTFGGWTIPISIILLVFPFVVKIEANQETKPGAWLLTAIIGLQLLGYFFIYVITPHDLEWHLETSMSRLLLQVYPTVMFLLFSVTPVPEKIFE